MTRKPFRVGRSRTGLGLFATEAIKKGAFIAEYKGRRVTNAEADELETRGSRYMYELNSYWTLDGSLGGSGAEFINHSCEPNLETRILRGHILYFSLRRIRRGEELTVDYNFDAKVERVQCICGAGSCRGTINVKR